MSNEKKYEGLSEDIIKILNDQYTEDKDDNGDKKAVWMDANRAVAITSIPHFEDLINNYWQWDMKPVEQQVVKAIEVKKFMNWFRHLPANSTKERQTLQYRSLLKIYTSNIHATLLFYTLKDLKPLTNSKFVSILLDLNHLNQLKGEQSPIVFKLDPFIILIAPTSESDDDRYTYYDLTTNSAVFQGDAPVVSKQRKIKL